MNKLNKVQNGLTRNKLTNDDIIGTKTLTQPMLHFVCVVDNCWLTSCLPPSH